MSCKVNVGYKALTDPHQLWLDLNEKCPCRKVTKNELGYMFVICLYVVFLCSVVLYVVG